MSQTTISLYINSHQGDQEYSLAEKMTHFLCDDQLSNEVNSTSTALDKQCDDAVLHFLSRQKVSFKVSDRNTPTFSNYSLNNNEICFNSIRNIARESETTLDLDVVRRVYRFGMLNGLDINTCFLYSRFFLRILSCQENVHLDLQTIYFTDVSTKELSANALSANALSANALSANALSANALSANTLSELINKYINEELNNQRQLRYEELEIVEPADPNDPSEDHSVKLSILGLEKYLLQLYETYFFSALPTFTYQSDYQMFQELCAFVFPSDKYPGQCQKILGIKRYPGVIVYKKFYGADSYTFSTNSSVWKQESYLSGLTSYDNDVSIILTYDENETPDLNSIPLGIYVVNCSDLDTSAFSNTDCALLHQHYNRYLHLDTSSRHVYTDQNGNPYVTSISNLAYKINTPFNQFILSKIMRLKDLKDKNKAIFLLEQIHKDERTYFSSVLSLFYLLGYQEVNIFSNGCRNLNCSAGKSMCIKASSKVEDTPKTAKRMRTLDKNEGGVSLVFDDEGVPFSVGGRSTRRRYKKHSSKRRYKKSTTRRRYKKRFTKRL
jgi:hypothetical protein